MYGGFGFDNSRIPNLMQLLALHSGGLPLMNQFNGNPGMIQRPMPPMMPVGPQPVQGMPQLPQINQPPRFDGGIPNQPVATPQPVNPGSGYTTLPAQRPALQPQQIQGIMQRWGQSSY